MPGTGAVATPIAPALPAAKRPSRRRFRATVSRRLNVGTPLTRDTFSSPRRGWGGGEGAWSFSSPWSSSSSSHREERRPFVAVAAVAAAAMGEQESADRDADGRTTTTRRWTVRVWTQPGKEEGNGVGGGPPLWERQLVTPNIRLVRGERELCDDGEGADRGASAAAASASACADDTDASAAAMQRDDDADANASTFDASAYFATLRTRRDGRAALLTARELPSTQDLVQENAAAAAIPPGVVCVADLQVDGRGRGGNAWTSPPGCLMFSLLTTHAEGRTLPFVQYIATMAAVEAIQDAADEAMSAAAGVAFRRGTGRTVDVRIKWPNDLYSGGLKIGGVLCTSTYSDGAFDVVVGVGINLDNDAPTTCVNRVIADRLARDGMPPPRPPLTRERLLAAFMNRFEALCGLLAASGGFAPLESAYLRQWLHTDQEVSLEDGGVKDVRLTVKGVTSTGYLLAVDDKGARYELHPDGNSLDFFKGLVRKKLPS